MAKASSNFWREIWSSSPMVCCVSAMDCSRSARSRSRKVKRCSHSLYSSSAIMFTGPMASTRDFISWYCVSEAAKASPSSRPSCSTIRSSGCAFSSFRHVARRCSRSAPPRPGFPGNFKAPARTGARPKRPTRFWSAQRQPRPIYGTAEMSCALRRWMFCMPVSL